MIIRDANEKDLHVCERLLHLPEFKFPNGEFPSVDNLEDFLEKDYFLVAEDEERIIGCIIGEPLKVKSVLIWYLVIDQERRGEGIGKKLLQNFEKKMRRKNLEWLYLQTQAATSGFYAKNNYQKGQQLQEFSKQLKRKTK